MYKGNFTDTALGYQVVGWYHNITPKCRSNNNLSDGRIFPNEQQAKQYVIDSGMHLLRINQCSNVKVHTMAFHVESSKLSLAGQGFPSPEFWSYFPVKQRTEAYKHIDGANNEGGE